MTTISLDNYSIHVGETWTAFHDWLQEKQYSQFFILVDENTQEYCLPLFLENTGLSDAKIILIRSGEQHKNIHTCSYIWQELIDQRADRRALVINLGGGVIGDMGGFCAGTYKRGIDFIQIPTTLLSQVDSSIGGKLGIDFGQVKNSVGLFQNPQAVFINPLFLQTLPLREIRSGFAEIVKHSLIADAALWKKLSKIEDLSTVDWTALLLPSLAVKKRVVEADPFEHNVRKTLNFGHTIGHAIESWALASPKPMLHGEAIAAGMICETYLSNEIAGLATAEVAEVKEFILKIYDKYTLNDTYFPNLIRLMKNDKKNEGDAINFTMLQSIGEPLINQHCSESQIVESLSYYAAL